MPGGAELGSSERPRRPGSTGRHPPKRTVRLLYRRLTEAAYAVIVLREQRGGRALTLTSIPVGAFQGAADIVIVSDDAGRVRFLNTTAQRVLAVEPEAILGAPCWLVARLRHSDGSSFCGPHCPIQQLAMAGVCSSRRPVVLGLPQGSERRADLYSLTISPIRGGRAAMLHLLTPEAGLPWLDEAS